MAQDKKQAGKQALKQADENHVESSSTKPLQSVEEDLSAGTITSSQMSSSASLSEELVDRTLVKVKIEYSDDFKGTRYFENGAIYEMSRESADGIIKQGIGKEC